MRPESFVAVCWWTVMAAMYAAPSVAAWIFIACAFSIALPVISYGLDRWYQAHRARPDMPRARLLRRGKEKSPPII